MSDKTMHHGRHSFAGKNMLCSMSHFSQERIGKFGRMFREGFHPLYTDPNILAALGKKGGIMDGGSTDEVTHSVPLGMVFLGQFIDHDITFDTVSSLSNVNEAADITNTRTPHLDLDSIYGGGPENTPFLYHTEKTGDNKMLLLLNGKINNNIGQGKDIESNDLARNGKGTALIGDPRNDENLIISQLQLAFINFHNALTRRFRSDNKYKELGSKELYEEVRKLVTWHYQWIVINEFLPAMCGHDTVSDILGAGRKFYQPCKVTFIPVEFSVAAYRFGHSMIRQKMKLQHGGKILELFGKDFGIGFTPIKSLSKFLSGIYSLIMVMVNFKEPQN